MNDISPDDTEILQSEEVDTECQRLFGDLKGKIKAVFM